MDIYKIRERIATRCWYLLLVTLLASLHVSFHASFVLHRHCLSTTVHGIGVTKLLRSTRRKVISWVASLENSSGTQEGRGVSIFEIFLFRIGSPTHINLVTRTLLLVVTVCIINSYLSYLLTN